MPNLIKKHWLVLALACLFGIIVVYPTIDAIAKIGPKNFRGIYPIFSDDEEYYIARTQEVLDGHPGLGNLYLKEHKDKPFMSPPLAEIFFAYTAKLFHIPAPTLFAICDFLLPFIGIIVLYILFYDITGEKLISAPFSFLFYLFAVRQAGRAINQQFIFILLFLGMWLVWRIYNSKDSNQYWKYNLYFGLVFGALLYIYPFFWTPLVAAYGLCLLAKAYLEKNIYFLLKNCAVFFVISAALAIPYALNFINASSDSTFSETVLRLGLLNNHWPASFYNIAPILGITMALILLASKFRSKDYLYFAYALSASGILLNWQNIITGKYLLFSVHYREPSFLIAFIILAIIIKEANLKIEAKRKIDYLKALISIFLIVLVAGFFAYRTWNDMKVGVFQRISKSEMLKLQEKRNIFDWLNMNTPKDSAIFYQGEEITRMLLPIYTHNNLYWGGYSTSFLVTDDELLERWARQNLFNDNITVEYLKNENNIGTLLALRFIDKYQNKLVRKKVIKTLTGIDIGQPEYLPGWYTDKVIRIYEEARSQDPETALKKFAIDYIVIDEDDEVARNAEERIKEIKNFMPVAQVNEYRIYEVE